MSSSTTNGVLPEIMRAVYVIGPSGSGKSTFVSEVISNSGITFGPNESVHTCMSSRLGKPFPVTITGHTMYCDGKYLGKYIGVMREYFPGSDGLISNSSITATDWALRASFGSVLAEGSKLGTRRFLAALEVNFDLMVVSLDATEEELFRRRSERESKTTEDNALRTVARSRRLAKDLKNLGYYVLDVDSASVDSWNMAVKKASEWLVQKGTTAQ